MGGIEITETIAPAGWRESRHRNLASRLGFAAAVP
jgi:hypothetical protein